MSNAIDAEQVRRIATLARLKLTDDEIAEFAGQLGRVLDYITLLEAVDTTGVEPLVHPLQLLNVMRDDVPVVFDGADTALANAPQREGRFFKAPAVLDQS